jgi:hypothetical protein
VFGSVRANVFEYWLVRRFIPRTYVRRCFDSPVQRAELGVRIGVGLPTATMHRRQESPCRRPDPSQLVRRTTPGRSWWVPSNRGVG